ncbi:MAG: ribosome maturation factor RimM [Bacteroidales bacterium]
MTYKNQILLGRITRIHGYDGTVAIRLEKAFTNNIPEMESVFIESDGRPVPFFISEWEYQGGDILKLRLEGYNTIEKVSEFNGCLVFLTSSSGIDTSVQKDESISGFKVLLKDESIIGTINDIIQNPGQNLLRIVTPENKEILIPFHEDFIIKVDEKMKTITMDLPDGLTGLND